MCSITKFTTVTIAIFLFTFTVGIKCSDVDWRLKTKLLEARCQSYCRTQENENTLCTSNDCDCSIDLFNHGEDVSRWLNISAIKPPKLKCKEDSMAYFLWKSEKNVTYFLEVWDTNLQRNLSEVTHCGYMELQNLNSNTLYKIRLWGVSYAASKIDCSEYVEFITQDRDRDPLPVANMSLDSLILNEGHYDAIVRWTPGTDMSCFYHLVWFGGGELEFGGGELGDVTEAEVHESSGLSLVKLSDLAFNSTYSVAIRAKRPGLRRESSPVELQITIPSCLDSYADLNRCPPETPMNLTVKEFLANPNTPDDEVVYNMNISWAKPKFIPNYYDVTIQNYPPNERRKNIYVPGNQTTVIFENLYLGPHYHIALTAWSAAGPSKTIGQDRHLEKTIISPVQLWSISQLVMAIVGTLSGVLVFIGSLMIFNYYKSRRERIEQRCKYFTELDEKSADAIDNLNADFETRTNPDEWELSADDLVLQTVLGEGAFGIVRRAYLHSKEGETKEVAIKMLKDTPTTEELRQFTQEIEIMKSVKQHSHVVSLIGCITQSRPEGPLLVVEYCSRGDLQTYLRTAWDKLVNEQREIMYIDQSRDDSGKQFMNHTYGILDEDLAPNYSIQPKHLISIARQVAMGMEHLAKTRVVHRDLAARNVLVCEDRTVKVSDFGLSRDVYQDNVYCKSGGGKLPIRWMALESLTHQRYTTQSDVWSFGILLWEIVTLGATPYPGVQSQDLLAMLKTGYRLERPNNCSNELYTIMRSCWKAPPKDRPNFTDLLQSLDDLLETVSEYLHLDLTSPTEISNVKLSKLIMKTDSTERYVKPINVYR